MEGILKINRIKKRIQKLKDKLNSLIEQGTDLLDPKVIRISMILDKQLNWLNNAAFDFYKEL